MYEFLVYFLIRYTSLLPDRLKLNLSDKDMWRLREISNDNKQLLTGLPLHSNTITTIRNRHYQRLRDLSFTNQQALNGLPPELRNYMVTSLKLQTLTFIKKQKRKYTLNGIFDHELTYLENHLMIQPFSHELKSRPMAEIYNCLLFLVTQYGKNDKDSLKKLLLYSVLYGNDVVLNFVIAKAEEQELSLDVPLESKKSLIHLAALTGDVNKIKLLLNYNLPLNTEDKFGRTPLYYAMHSGSLGAVKLLMKSEISNFPSSIFSFRSAKNESLLFPGAESGNFQLIKQILKWKIDCFASKKQENHLEQYHLANFIYNLVETDFDQLKSDTCKEFTLLRSLFQDKINLHNKSGETVIHSAVRGGNVHIVKLLMDFGAKLPNKGSPLAHAAVQSKNTAVLRYIISQGISVNQLDSKDRTPLHTVLMELRSLTKLQSQFNAPVLKYSDIPESYKSLITCLLELKADIHQKDKQGITPAGLLNGLTHQWLSGSTREIFMQKNYSYLLTQEARQNLTFTDVYCSPKARWILFMMRMLSFGMAGGMSLATALAIPDDDIQDYKNWYPALYLITTGVIFLALALALLALEKTRFRHCSRFFETQRNDEENPVEQARTLPHKHY